MNVSFEEQVRARAYQIWIAAGMADGMAHDHWVSAEQSVMNEHAVPTKAKAAMPKASAKVVASPKPAAKATSKKKAAAKGAN